MPGNLEHTGQLLYPHPPTDNDLEVARSGNPEIWHRSAFLGIFVGANL